MKYEGHEYSMTKFARRAQLVAVLVLVVSMTGCAGVDGRVPGDSVEEAFPSDTSAFGQPFDAAFWFAPNMNRKQYVDIASVLPGGAHEDPDVTQANSVIDTAEAAALAELPSSSSLDLYHQLSLLGTLILYDKTLSVAKNLACTSCHAPETGFTGASSLLNLTIVAQPGSVAVTNAVSPAPNYRLSNRKPQSYGYAAFSPILEYVATQNNFYGGNFWDMRATGLRLGNPAAEQALGPPVNPVEMGLSDTACMVYRICQGPYRSLFEQVWGPASFAIAWPPDVEQVCTLPGPPPLTDPLPVHLSELDREISNSAFDHMGQAAASYEASSDVSPFSSKFDAYLAGTVTLTQHEQRGYDLFRGKALCNQCHLDGSANGPSDRSSATDVAPLLTDFAANNIGVPRNANLPWYDENQADQYGYTANPAGRAFTDKAIGGFLSGTGNPNRSSWAALAPQFNGAIQTPTLRNVDKRPRRGFVKAYMHNGYLKSLREVVHFYNTSQALPRCAPGSRGENVTCWPPPEVPDNLNTTQLGNLHLTSEEETDIVSFMQTLTDGYVK